MSKSACLLFPKASSFFYCLCLGGGMNIYSVFQAKILRNILTPLPPPPICSVYHITRSGEFYFLNIFQISFFTFISPALALVWALSSSSTTIPNFSSVITDIFCLGGGVFSLSIYINYLFFCWQHPNFAEWMECANVYFLFKNLFSIDLRVIYMAGPLGLEYLSNQISYA